MSENSENNVEDDVEAIQENLYQVSALIALLEQKGILTRQELRDEVEGLKTRDSQ